MVELRLSLCIDRPNLKIATLNLVRFKELLFLWTPITLSPILYEHRPIQNVARTVGSNVALTIIGRVSRSRGGSAIGSTPVLYKERPIQDIADSITVQIAPADIRRKLGDAYMVDVPAGGAISTPIPAIGRVQETQPDESSVIRGQIN
jgi:hypothetical protein